MKKVGIIAEYNPFHNGHLYHLEQVKKMFPDSLIVLVLSGHFTERGIPSVLNKWAKTEIALHYGVDLVVELPFPFATQSADIFAKGAITILKELKVDYLVFGSESNDIKKLAKLAEVQLTNDYQEEIKKELKKGNNYPTALANALKSNGNRTIREPNDILGFSYIREIKRQNAAITPICIKRTTEYHDTEITQTVASATSIRQALKKGNKIDNVVPTLVLPYLKKKIPTMEDYFPFLKYQIQVNRNHLDQFQTVEEGIEKRIEKIIDQVHSYEEFVAQVKSKRYTYARIGRMATHILCGFTKEEAKKWKEVPYIRILGFSTQGRKELNKRKKEMTLPLITKFKKEDALLQKEKQVTSIYATCFDKKDQEQSTRMEYQTPPLKS